MKKFAVCLTVLLLSCTLTSSGESKEYDSDVICDESKVAHYDLPVLLAAADGKTAEALKEWMKALTSESSPPVCEAIIESDVGYHVRQGGHSIGMYRWEDRFPNFADYHLKKLKSGKKTPNAEKIFGADQS